MSSSSPPATHPLHARRDAALVVAFQVAMLVGFDAHIDLQLADEVIYQEQGHALLRGEPEAKMLGYGPVYSPLYALVQLFPLRGAEVQDAVTWITGIGGPLALWWALRGFAGPVAAVLGAAWWGGAPLVIGFPVRIYVFTAIFWLLALGAVARGRTTLALTLLAVAAFNRLEHLPWLGLAGVLVAVHGWRTRGRRAGLRGVLFAAIAAGLMVTLTTSPSARQHSWLAFQDHYAGHAASPPGQPPRISTPLAQQRQVVARDFGAADSVLAAGRANPGALARHVLRNAGFVPSNIAENLTTPWRHAPLVRWGALLLVGLLALAGLGRSRIPISADAHLLLWSAWAVVPGLLLVYPRSGFVLAASLSLLIAVMRAADAGAAAVARALPRRAAHAMAGAALVAPLLFAAAVGGPHRQAPASSCPGRDAIRVLQRAAIDSHDRVGGSAAHGLLRLANLDAVPVGLNATAASPLDADWVLLCAWDIGSPAEAAALVQLGGEHWRLVDAGWSTSLFRREVDR